MSLYTEAGDPVFLTGYGRAAVSATEHLSDDKTIRRWLPSAQIDDIRVTVEMNKSFESDLAEARAFDAESTIGSESSESDEKTYKLWAVSRKARISETSQLVGTGTTEEKTAKLVKNAAANHAIAVANRYEVAGADAIFNGRIVVNENDFKATLNFGRPAEHSVTATKLWSAADATPLTDLTNYLTKYRKLTGQKAGAVLLSGDIRDAILLSPEIKDALATAFVTEEMALAFLASLGMPQMHVHDYEVGRGANRRRVTPADKIAFLPAAGDPNSIDANPESLGATFWTRSAEAKRANYGLSEEDQYGIVVGAFEEEDPAGIWVRANGVATPALINPVNTFIAKVL